MNSFWTALLRKAIAALMGYNWELVVSTVRMLLNESLSGDQKRQAAFDLLRKSGVDSATWLIYAAIEIAYGTLKK